MIVSVRFRTSRDTGVATVISNNPHTNTIINVDMGKQHANQTFVDATGFSTEALTTDTNGILTVPVLGKTNPYAVIWEFGCRPRIIKEKDLTTASRVSMHPSFHL